MIDDDTFSAQSLSKMVEKLGFRVERAYNQTQTMEMIEAKANAKHGCCLIYQIIFVDYNIMGITGPQLIKQIFSFYNQLNVEKLPYVIACSGKQHPPLPAFSFWFLERLKQAEEALPVTSFALVSRRLRSVLRIFRRAGLNSHSLRSSEEIVPSVPLNSKLKHFLPLFSVGQATEMSRRNRSSSSLTRSSFC